MPFPIGRVLVAEVEHAAVRECVQRLARLGRCELVNLPVDDCGIVRPKVVEDAIATGPRQHRAAVSVMWANNETGVVQPIADIGAVCRAHGVRFHTDAIQAIGRIPVDLSEVPVDLLTLSGHKFHGPKGIGALVVRPGLRLARRTSADRRNVNVVGGLKTSRAWLALVWPPDWPKRGWPAPPPRNARGSLPLNAPCVPPSPTWWCTVSVRNGCGTRVVWASRPSGRRAVVATVRGGCCLQCGQRCASGSMEPMHSLLAVGMDEAMAGSSLRFSVGRDFPLDGEATARKVLSVLAPAAV